MKDSSFKHFNPMALRDKHTVKNNTNNYSSFWMDSDWDNRNTSIFDEDDVQVTKPKTDLVALSAYKRAISNFVTIVTGESDIKVHFNSNDESYTDGKTVTIGAKMDDKLFDPSVGLALHEGSHIKLSDFDFLRNLENNIPQEYFTRGEKKGYGHTEVLGHIKNLLNYVEDRRIDNFVFTTSPGYKGYYHSMYEKYFYSKVVDKALLSDEYTDETMDSYMFRIINLTNKNTNLDALNGLRQIWKDLDIKNIGVLGNTKIAFNVALNIYSTILDNLKDGVEETDEYGNKSTKPNDGSNESTEGQESQESGDSKTLSDEEFERLKDAMSEGDVKQGHSNGSDIKLSDNQKKQLENAIRKQEKFMNGDIQKKKVTKKESKELQTIDASGMTYEDVGKDVGWNTQSTKCLVVRKLTKALIDASSNYDSGLSILSPYKYRYIHNYNDDTENTGFVEKGISLGTKLGRKLQVRGESRDTKWSRLDSGRIDKRLIAELGFGNERVFNTTFTESYSDAILHISVDASGSMSGEKWDNTMTSVVAICKAASMIQNVDVVVSIRSTHCIGGYRSRGNTDVPLILIAYDSRVDKFTKVKNMFGHIKVAGTTPEGLCFEAIMNEIVPTTKDRDSYFLNFSDGMPMFQNDAVSYYSDDALSHTKKMVNEMRTRDIKVLSYFIGGDYDRESYMGDFKKMYGKDAQFVDVTSVMSISKTMNKKFLEKN
tara:strand:- start:1270 stop:3405 length:2136 start_codon:yes stop_codon:yes gene_type:complete